MYLIAGLGNPEPEYSNTRHNMGFDCVNLLSKQYNIEVSKSNFKGLVGTGTVCGKKGMILKPQTYMNLSGECIKECMNFYKIPLTHLLVVYDDIDLEAGTIRVRKKGSAGTHNGMKSVINSLGSEEFTRVRIGISKPKEKWELLDYVTEKISKKEYLILAEGLELGKQAIEEFIKAGENDA